MLVIGDPKEMQQKALEAKREGKTIALFPTLGNMHQGHFALLDEARKHADTLIVSIFVNPTQFGAGEDFERYPRTLEKDLEGCKAHGVDWIFAPGTEQMYAGDFGTRVEVEGWSDKLCGESRPGHFRGVATVVAKLFNICQPDVAVWGWKDAQQFLLLKRMVRGLDMPVRMIGVETERDSHGLALSSRNSYLSPRERKEAPQLYKALESGRKAVDDGRVKTGAELTALVCSHIEKHTSAKIDYVEAVSMSTLDPVAEVQKGETLLAVAAYFGKTRLIDNIRL